MAILNWLCWVVLTIHGDDLLPIIRHLLPLPSTDRIPVLAQALPRMKSRKTLLYFMGLEGVGHHLVNDVLERLEKQFKSEVLIFRPQGGGWHGWGKDNPFVFKWNVESFQIRPKRFGDHMALWPMYSFPYSTVNRSTTSHPDLEYLLQVSRSADVEVRIVVGLRDPYSTLKSDCVHLSKGHRPYEIGWCSSQADELVVNARFMADQLRSVGRGQYTCAWYGDLDALSSGLAWALRLDKDTVRTAVQATWDSHENNPGIARKEILFDILKGGAEELLEGVSQLAKEIQPAFDELSAMCSSKRKMLRSVETRH